MYHTFKVASLPKQNNTDNKWEVKFILKGNNCKKAFDKYTEAFEFYMKCLYFTLVFINKRSK